MHCVRGQPCVGNDRRRPSRYFSGKSGGARDDDNNNNLAAAVAARKAVTGHFGVGAPYRAHAGAAVAAAPCARGLSLSLSLSSLWQHWCSGCCVVRGYGRVRLGCANAALVPSRTCSFALASNARAAGVFICDAALHLCFVLKAREGELHPHLLPHASRRPHRTATKPNRSYHHAALAHDG